MGFYDFVVGDIHGIRVKELREHTKKGGTPVNIIKQQKIGNGNALVT
jgi:hypothetical protein